MGLYFNLLTSSVAPLAFFSLHAALQDNARKLLSEYVPLKQDVNRMWTDLLDLEKLPEISDEERDRRTQHQFELRGRQLTVQR